MSQGVDFAADALAHARASDTSRYSTFARGLLVVIEASVGRPPLQLGLDDILQDGYSLVIPSVSLMASSAA